MTYKEAREFISNSNQYGSILGLDTITELLKRLGHPEEKLKIIHVAGTNGKGSTSAFITAILANAGYRVGRYISPTIYTYRERIQIVEKVIKNNIVPPKKTGDQKTTEEVDQNMQVTTPEVQYITREGVSRTIEVIEPICEAMIKEGYSHPTSFEIETAMTFLYLLWEKVDFVVLEVGLGGRLDATNVIRHPVLSVITSISMDHMQYLGDTLEKIAAEKAGIIKNATPVITCNQEPEVLRVFERAAKEQNTSLILADSFQVSEAVFTLKSTEFSYDNEQYRMHLLGKYQIMNAVLAIETAKTLNSIGYPISRADIRVGLESAVWSGRFEVISNKPTIIIDGAHNEDAARTLKESIEIYFTNQKLIYIIGVLADKDYKSILKLTAPLADRIFTLTPDNVRALSSGDLANEAAGFCNNVCDAGNVEQAVKLALAEAEEKDIILAFGSLSFLGDLVNTLSVTKG